MWLRRLKNKSMFQELISVLTLGFLLAPVLAGAQAVPQSYGTTGAVQQGMIVMLDPDNASNVTPLTNTNAKKMLGVAVSGSDTPVTLNGSASGTPAFVTTNGHTSVLVSTQNGAIKAGDTISISALDGVGMKADSGQPLILGKALADFSQQSTGANSAQIKTSAGTKQISVGLTQVGVDIGANPIAKDGASSQVPGFLQRIATAIAGKPVSAPRIYISVAVLLATFLISGSLLYGGVRSSLIAVGRNPLARSTVLKGMLQVLAVGLVILFIGMGLIYLLLRL